MYRKPHLSLTTDYKLKVLWRLSSLKQHYAAMHMMCNLAPQILGQCNNLSR